VNVAGRQLAHPNFIVEVQKALSRSGIHPHTLVLEITENAVMEREEQARQMLERLRELGVELHMDDFGTGLASLARNLKMGVIAEGIETAEQLAVLEGLGCDLGQGYLFSKPVTAEAAARLIS
jgi:EAL domain-containing protein (putative c-di-GMP-specific phosphodiesterase class I)